ncbi:MAG: ABC transporter substrate-binding protein, partial [Actinomycetota bacterium]
MEKTMIDRRRFIQLGLAAAGGLALEACNRGGPGDTKKTGPPPPPSDLSVPAARPTVRLGAQEGGFLSPFTYGPGTYSSLILLYDTLLLEDSKEVVQPWLASRFDRSPDGLTYTFELRENAKWHDGRPVTADDVIFSVDYFRSVEENLSPTVLFHPNFVQRVTASGPRTVVFRLEKPAANFLEETAAAFPIVPKHVWSAVKDPLEADDPALLVGSGPFRIEKSNLTTGAASFVANDDFYLGKPFMKKLEYRPVDEELIALQGKEIDGGGPQVGATTRDALSPFRNDPEYGIERSDPDFFAALLWNLKPGPWTGATSDAKFRKACVLAINRPAMVRRLLGSGLPGNAGFIPEGHPYYSAEGVEQYPFSVREANALLDEAGYRRKGGANSLRRTPDGKDLRVRLLTFPELEPAAIVVRQSLRDVGIAIEFVPSDLFRAVGGGELKKFEMALQFFGGLDRDPDYLRTLLASQTQGPGIFHSLGWTNPEFDDLAEKQLVTLDEAERKRLIARMQQIVSQDLPVMPLYYAPEFFVYRRSVFDHWGGDAQT